MPPPRRREPALAPCRGATLAPACWDSAVGTRGCPSPPWGRAAKRQCPFPSVPSPQQDCAIPSLATHPVCAGHAGTSPAINMAPRCWGTRWDGPQGQVSAGCLQQSRQESGSPRSRGAAACSHRHKMPKLWGETGSSDPAAACPAALSVSGPEVVPAGLQASLPAWDGATCVGAKGQGTALAVHSLQLCGNPSEVPALPYGQ